MDKEKDFQEFKNHVREKRSAIKRGNILYIVGIFLLFEVSLICTLSGKTSIYANGFNLVLWTLIGFINGKIFEKQKFRHGLEDAMIAAIEEIDKKDSPEDNA